jgi:hypothetical protein
VSIDETLVIVDYLKNKKLKFTFPNVSLDETLVIGDYLKNKKIRNSHFLTCD